MSLSAQSTAPSTSATLALLREWQSVCDACAAGTNHLLIRKGGIAEGRDGFQLRRSFFGLLPTLFHQVKAAEPDAQAPPPPSTVSVVCQLVEAYVVPSLAELAPLAAFHRYAPEQLAARQNYKPDRPLNVVLIRPFRLRAALTIDTKTVRPVCKSWAEIDLPAGLGGIDAAADVAESAKQLDAARRVLSTMQSVQLINVAPD